jgi:protein-disulfide isomerase
VAGGPTRRGILRVTALVAVAGLLVARPWTGWGMRDLDYEDIPHLPPLRRLATQAAASSGTATDALFLGLEAPDEPTRPAPLRTEPEDLCRFFDLAWAEGAPVPVTYFTDIRCPSCRVLEASLAGLARSDPGLFRLHIREFPIFGPRSEAAARVIRAADGQGASEILRRQLRTRPAPTSAEGVVALGGTLDLDPEALVEAWESRTVADSLAEDLALARRLGLRGTPGLVVGRTVVEGALPRATLLDLMRAERRDGPPLQCS